jgi:hypothetical protein
MQMRKEKTSHYKKPISRKGKQQERKKRMRELKKRKRKEKTMKCQPLNNHFKCKWIKLTNQRHRVVEWLKNSQNMPLIRDSI